MNTVGDLQFWNFCESRLLNICNRGPYLQIIKYIG